MILDALWSSSAARMRVAIPKNRGDRGVDNSMNKLAMKMEKGLDVPEN
jgi:hypothetical protein